MDKQTLLYADEVLSYLTAMREDKKELPPVASCL